MLPTLAPSSLTLPSHPDHQSLGEMLPLAPTQPFERFGCWAPSITVARDGTIGRLSRWIALQRNASNTPTTEKLWQRCQDANPECFRTYRVVKLDRPSYFLPAGDVVFEALENPTQIPEQPPTGVMLRHMEAMDTFPSATFYFLRPVFVAEPTFQLCTADELRREAYFDRLDAMRRARYFGWAFRTQAWLAAKRDAAAVLALRVLTRTVEALTWDLPTLPVRDPIKPRTPHPLRHQYTYRPDPTRSLGLIAERRRLEFALTELRRRMAVDPVLAFELADRPGELWFEAHWFIGRDARTYVHY
jgi:hypothetical protein